MLDSVYTQPLFLSLSLSEGLVTALNQSIIIYLRGHGFSNQKPQNPRPLYILLVAYLLELPLNLPTACFLSVSQKGEIQFKLWLSDNELV